MNRRHPLDDLTTAERALLDAFGFREADFRVLAARVIEVGFDPAVNWVREPIEAPPPDAFPSIPPRGTRVRDALDTAGAQAMAEGRLGVIVLNGGMATRFGGVVKGVVEALPGRSFLQLTARRILDLEERYGARIPVALMNSFATDEATRRHLDETGWLGLRREGVRTFVQGIMPRIRPDGSLFRDPRGVASFYGPGHGDACERARASGILDWLAAQGVEMVLVYNVDNLGAGPIPGAVGRHMACSAGLTAEVVEKYPGDTGGCLARVGGRVQILEGFRIPPGFDTSQVPVFNTNTLLVDLELLGRPYPLTWFHVLKRVEGGEVIQFERLVGELTAWIPSEYLLVPRLGPEGRFLPVKSPADLEALRPTYLEMFPRRGLRVLDS